MVLINDGHPRSEVACYPLVTLFYSIEKLVEKHGGKGNSGAQDRHSGRHMRVDKNSPMMRRMRGDRSATVDEDDDG